MDSIAHKFGKHEPDDSELKDAEDYLSEYGRKPPRLCYEAQFGFQCEHITAFATFPEALLFYRGYVACSKEREDEEGPSGLDYGPRIVNTDRADGSEDGNPSGLTQEEREAIEEVG
jgi:hypothetical protein